ncbi:1694_t:CDS:2 [Entrophospora sp. SA101]|nr:1694_t:CDS:2 [Entrophospora sp. SA101]
MWCDSCFRPHRTEIKFNSQIDREQSKNSLHSKDYALKSLNDSRDLFEAVALVDIREEIKYVITPRVNYPKKPRAKCCNYNPESKYYTTAKIKNFIKEIEEIKAESTQGNQTKQWAKYEKGRKSGMYNDTEIWKHIDMQDPKDFDNLGIEPESYGI